MSNAFYIGITDTDWMTFIRKKQKLGQIGNQINFWTPGNQTFKAIEPGDLFVFKLHSNSSKGEKGEIVGAGYYVGFERIPFEKAWQRFEYGNGAETKEHMISSIESYRLKNHIKDDGTVGCKIIEDPVFFDTDKWIDPPQDWGKFVVSGKKYKLTEESGRRLYDQISNVMNCYK